MLAFSDRDEDAQLLEGHAIFITVRISTALGNVRL
jgi:hypothetical protein